MQTWQLKATPNLSLEQADSFGFQYFLIIDPMANGSVVSPGDLIQVSAGGSPIKNIPPIIGLKFPWDDPNGPFWGPFSLDATGSLANPSGIQIKVPATPMGPLTPEGTLVCNGITAAGNRSPFSGYVCAYQDPTPVAPVAPNTFAGFITAVQASWNTRVPIVDYYAASNWALGSFLANTPFSAAPVTVSFGQPVSLTQAAGNILAAAMGGTCFMQPPLSADLAEFYNPGSGAIAGSLSPVPYVTAMVPLGPDGALVKATALAGAVVQAMAFGRVTGLESAILATFVPAA